jgi:hypothetical protein
VIDGVGDSGGCPDVAQFSDTFYPSRVDEFVLLRDESDVMFFCRLWAERSCPARVSRFDGNFAGMYHEFPLAGDRR